MINTLMYLEINVICIFILIYILANERSRHNRMPDNKVFDRVVIAAMAILATDALQALIDKRLFGFNWSYNWNIYIWTSTGVANGNTFTYDGIY